MDWITIGAITQVIGSLAVIISLIYLAKEVKNGMKSLKTTIRDSSFHNLMEWNYYMISEPDLAWIFQQGCKNIDSLNEKERIRFVHISFSLFKLYENLYLHYLDKSINLETWEFNNIALKAYAIQPGLNFYWEQRKFLFHPSFQKFVDSIEQNPKNNNESLEKFLHTRLNQS
jgi:hypothetical protein